MRAPLVPVALLLACASQPPPAPTLVAECEPVGASERKLVAKPGYDPSGCTVAERLQHVEPPSGSFESMRRDDAECVPVDASPAPKVVLP